MKITKKETIVEGQYLRFVRKYFETGSGKTGIWETIERRNIYQSHPLFRSRR